jgi:hypothetical protein
MGSLDGKVMSLTRSGSGLLMYGRPSRMAFASTATAVQPWRAMVSWEDCSESLVRSWGLLCDYQSMCEASPGVLLFLSCLYFPEIYTHALTSEGIMCESDLLQWFPHKRFVISNVTSVGLEAGR